MDEGEFKKTYAEFNGHPCVFAKAVLRRCAGCSRAQRVFIAEREAVACLSPKGHVRCAALVERLRENALFALRLTQLDGPLPHGKEMKVECGGLLGLQAAVDGREAEPVADIHGLVGRALERWHEFPAFPYSRIAQAVVRYRPRRRSRG